MSEDKKEYGDNKIKTKIKEDCNLIHNKLCDLMYSKKNIEEINILTSKFIFFIDNMRVGNKLLVLLEDNFKDDVEKLMEHDNFTEMRYAIIEFNEKYFGSKY